MLSEKLEKEQIEYNLGPAMMEPDHRIKTNQLGFCRRHFKLLFEESNKLSLALVLQSHLMEIENKFFENVNENELISVKKKPFWSRNSENNSFLENYLDNLEKVENSCVICKQIDFTMDRYFEVTLHLWKTEQEFKTVFENSKGFCLPHFRTILGYAVKKFNNKPEFIKLLFRKQKENFKRLEEEICWFSQKFDYRNNDAPWGNSQDSIIRTIQKISSNI